MTDNTPGQVPEALDDLYLKLHGLSKHLESSGRIDESDAPEAYPAILDAMNLVRRLQSEAAQVPSTTAQPVQDYAELLESDEHIGTEERNEIAAELRRLHAQVAALTAQPAAPQGVAEVNWWEVDGDKYDDSITRAPPAPTAQAAPAAGAVAGPSLQEIQWRNIRKVVDALADFCFGSQDDPRWGVAHVAIRTSLTAKDGLDVQALKLEPLAAPTPATQADSVLEDAADPLQGAADWLAEAHGQFSPVVLSGCLMIGYNRAKRLHDAALAARKQGGA